MAEKVYVVHCVDTEGPLYESIDANFERIEDIFGVKVEHTRENLKKLQNCELDCGGKEAAIADVLAEKRITMLGSWPEVDEMLARIMSPEFRNALADTAGRGWLYNWFCISHVGFTGENPRRRDAGYHNIYDHYRELVYSQTSGEKDHIYFHYHPLPFRGDYHMYATSYVAGSNLFEILARKIIDRGFFAGTYRPGFHTERPDSHWFLEQWIPFDYANQACSEDYSGQEDMANGRFGDWRRAPKEWRPYHPSHDDYQRKGNCHRWITRCLNMDARIRSLTQKDVDDAFMTAQNGQPAILAFTDHDFRDMSRDIDRVRNMISISKEAFPDVPFYFSSAADAMRNVIGLEAEPCELNIELRKSANCAKAIISAGKNIFGSQPFFAIKTATGQYFWDNLDYEDPAHNVWAYQFDVNNFPINAIDKIGVAANSPSGVSEVIVLDVATGAAKRTIHT